ncbi:50S ribosomal protein L21 [Varunaivibrio sulfuroxidans]|uniref:Large ribosomal subunit protein bL21 n=1 Tax=Varunaivibrio sulfuroxidans TaxID=1773489 RepID=A0A4R3J6B6_9PROT|nr:50S ribosomal protein L21 [Varunaivibrio sulfuroxidans]TCS60864.1 LSU ribosomal protein L21P [Varunaivibrio sulfuroxidans]
MFAVIKTGGKQYRVSENDILTIEKVAGDAGDAVEFNEVLMVGEDGKAPSVGTPLLDKAAVYGEVIDQTRGAKIIVFKKKRRQNYRRKKGHRQDLTLVRITQISATGAKKAPAKAKVETASAEAPVEKAPVKKAAPKKAAAEAKPAAKKAAPKKTDKKTEE